MQTNTPRQYIDGNIVQLPLPIQINTLFSRQPMEDECREIEKSICKYFDDNNIMKTDPLEYWNNKFFPKKNVLLNNLHYEEEAKENVSNNITKQPQKSSLMNRRKLMMKKSLYH